MSDSLELGEDHPSSHIAYGFIQEYLAKNKSLLIMEALASNAIEGNRLAEIALGTLERLLDKKPVSDRYLMGLAWLLWEMESN